ncbi:hypothetical protein [Acidobacterium sp. S8]|uniref:hypothetical protein n=1 Tax=Acidobacterium sp. S8 TaxID=1641854 RepID=UPI00131A97F6|nr:hypothetical protein [Acidobacterium sp. S8]
MTEQNYPDTAEIFDRFTALASIALEAGGLLVFAGELDRRGMAIAVASNIAGAASLAVDGNAERAKQALRQGICDFMVNSLDEALRILKNEIRKKQPVSVVLVSDPAQSAAAMLERGVQPDLVAGEGLQSEKFVERGAKVLPAAVATVGSLVVTWSVSQDAAKWLPLVDAVAAEALGSDEDSRVKWLRLGPRYLQKQLSKERYVRFTADELVRFVGLLQQRIHSGEIAVPVEILSDGQPVIQPSSSAAV